MASPHRGARWRNGGRLMRSAPKRQNARGGDPGVGNQTAITIRNPEHSPAPDISQALLEISASHADGGHRVGKDPRDVPFKILSLYHREKNPLKALRARCLDCCSDCASEVRKCVSVNCPSWPFRMGVNPFRKKPELSEERKRAMAERLASARRAS